MNPPRPVLVVNDSPGDWLDVRPPDRAVLHIGDLPIVERDDIGTPTPTVSPLRVGDAVELATHIVGCDGGWESCRDTCPAPFASARVAGITVDHGRVRLGHYVTLVDIEAMP